MAKILVIEDEPELRELMTSELAYSGHRVIQAENGEQGLQKILNEDLDIILADVNMPKMSGHQLRGRLKQSHPQQAKIPFVFVTALADESDIADGQMIGVDHYVTKPIDFDKLEGWIRDLTTAK